MPQIIMAPQATGSKRLDGSVRKQAYAFLEKLSDDDATPGLHIEPIHGCVDPRVRTGRVSDYHRAVLVKLQGQGSEAHYVYLGTYGHDDAIALAKKARLAVNPVNGIAELVTSPPSPVAPGQSGEWTTPVPATAEAPRIPEPAVLLADVSLSDLVDRLGIEPRLAERTLALTGEDDLLTLVEDAVQWQASALLDLATGRSLEEVRASLSLDETLPADPDAVGDAQILVGLQHPAARMQFALIEDDEELRRAIEDDDFEAWRVFLHPEQRRYVARSYHGPFRLSGGAGTGKTVVLVHRARHLARRDPAARILLTTYTTTLAESLRAALRALDPDLPLARRLGDPGIYVSGIDAAVSAVLRGGSGAGNPDVERVLGPRSSQINQRTRSDVWQQVIEAAGDELPPDLRSPAFFVAEYVMVILPARITTLEGYLKARRPGRGVALDRKRRTAVWQVVQAYRARAGVDGSLDFAEAAAVAAARLDDEAARGRFRCDHVLIDEGQDLNPTHWQFARAMVAEHDDDLFIAEDSQQRIYGQRVVLGRYGIRIVGRSQRLTLNYRTTAQNLHFAVRVLAGESFVDLEEEAEDNPHYRSARRGPSPELIPAPSLGAELDRAAGVVRDWLTDGAVPETVGVLVRDNRQLAQVTRGLEERKVSVRALQSESARPGQPLVLTMHRAKGMEFSRVLIFDAGRSSIPAAYLLRGLNDADREDILRKERSLLYVAATRARDELVITWSGEASSMLPDVTAANAASRGS